MEDMLCLSHVRWDFVFQRPQQLMTRFAKRRRVFFVEPPVWGDGPPRLEARTVENGVVVLLARLTRTWSGSQQVVAAQKRLLDEFLEREHIASPVLWYDTPMALAYSAHLEPELIVYDCMDELALRAGAPRDVPQWEAELLRRADLVFTCGMGLYGARRGRHANVHLFLSGVDRKHFSRARVRQAAPRDQRSIPRPRIGYAGVIDERIDVDLLAEVAARRPDFQLVLLGPVANIDPNALPRASNIHYLGIKRYAELPEYMAGWDVGMIPFAKNDATRFSSPTQTAEYLAAGLPVVSTAVRDVMRPYGLRNLAAVAESTDEFVQAIEAARLRDPARQRDVADAFLAHTTWDETAERMEALIERAIQHGTTARVLPFARAALPELPGRPPPRGNGLS